MKVSSDGDWRYFNGGRYRIPDLRSSRGKCTGSEIGFYPGDLEERLTRGTQRTTGLMVRYEVVKALKCPITLMEVDLLLTLAGILYSIHHRLYSCNPR